MQEYVVDAVWRLNLDNEMQRVNSVYYLVNPVVTQAVQIHMYKLLTFDQIMGNAVLELLRSTVVTTINFS